MALSDTQKAIASIFPIQAKFATLSLERVGGDNFDSKIEFCNTKGIVVTIRVVFWDYCKQTGGKEIENIMEQQLTFIDPDVVRMANENPKRFDAYLTAWAMAVRQMYQYENPALPPSEYVQFKTHPLTLQRPQSVDDFYQALCVSGRMGRFM